MKACSCTIWRSCSLLWLFLALGLSAEAGMPAEDSPTCKAGSNVAVTMQCAPGASPVSASGASAAKPERDKAGLDPRPHSLTPLEWRLRDGFMLGLAVFAGVFALAALLLFWKAVRQAQHDGGFRYRSDWGGFGGTGSGWEFSSAGVSLLAATLLTLGAVVLTMCLLQSLAPAAADGGGVATKSEAKP